MCRQALASGDLAGESDADMFETCVNDTGTTVVFPTDGDASCDEFGMAPFSFDIDDEALAISRAQREIERFLLVTERCVPPAVAEEEVKRVLVRYGLSGWTAQVAGDFEVAVDNCATAAFDRNQSTVVIVPVPPVPD